MNMPPEADNAVCAVRRRLAESLLAVYLHGSAVSGGLHPHSDIDLLAVTSTAMDAEVRKELAADLLKVSGRYPFDPHGRRPVELIVFTKNDLCPLSYPAQCDFIYGEWLRPTYEVGDIPGPVSDPEFTLLLAQARQEAKTLFGPDADELLPVVSHSDLHRAMADVSQALLKAAPGDERNILLTLARMWRTLDKGDFVSKDVAAEWSAGRLPEMHASILLDARSAYLGLHPDDLQQRQQQVAQTIQELYKRVSSIDIMASEEGDPNENPWVAGKPKREDISLEPYSAEWTRVFESQKNMIARILGETALAIEHVGSTAVPDLLGKPVIDIDLIVKDPNAENTYVPALVGAGYGLTVREHSWYEHRMLRLEQPRVNVHVFGPGCPEHIRHLLFRDWLRERPADRQLYAGAKLEAGVGVNTAHEYNQRKQAVVREIYQKIFVAHGWAR